MYILFSDLQAFACFSANAAVAPVGFFLEPQDARRSEGLHFCCFQ